MQRATLTAFEVCGLEVRRSSTPSAVEYRGTRVVMTIEQALALADEVLRDAGAAATTDARMWVAAMAMEAADEDISK